MSNMELEVLVKYFGDRLQQNLSLAGLTTARVGGPACFLVAARTTSQLSSDVNFLWEIDFPFLVLGSGSNVLVSDVGIEALVIHNQAKQVTIQQENESISIFAESGASLAAVSRLAARNALSGLEWACTIPGSVGGAVYGNAGAHGADMKSNLVTADIVHREKGALSITAGQMDYSYRSSALKRAPGSAVILASRLAVQPGDKAEIDEKMHEYSARRRSTQPAGASMGSIFKNPQGDFAGRLIEASGLKGTRIGGVQVSPIHANFMVNDGSATADDYFELIKLVQSKVLDTTGITLELEIELIGFTKDRG